MYEPDIPQLEVQKSMARIGEAASKTQEAPAKILNKQLAKDLPAEFKINMSADLRKGSLRHFNCYYVIDI